MKSFTLRAKNKFLAIFLALMVFSVSTVLGAMLCVRLIGPS